MSLDGLRAWIGEVERKLGARTRVFLVLLAIAIGASGAAIYLALDARDNDSGAGSSGGASVAEVQALREQVELEAGASPEISTLEAQIVELRTEVEGLEAEEEGSGSGTGKGGGSGGKGGGSESDAIPETEAKPIPESGAEK